MSDDLERAVAAYREVTREEPGDRGVDRLELALRRPPRRRSVAVYVLPMAAALLVGSAWGSGALTRWFGGHAENAVEPKPPQLPTSAMPVHVLPPEPVASAPPAEAPSTPRPAPAKPAPPDLDALYRQAHDAQFAAHDPKAALSAWDRYLAHADPSARLLLEARYNRALTLRDLGRNAEARTALQPFAEGDYGAYRREDATRILQGMQSR